MKAPLTLIRIALIALGPIALLYEGIAYTSHEKMVVAAARKSMR